MSNKNITWAKRNSFTEGRPYCCKCAKYCNVYAGRLIKRGPDTGMWREYSECCNSDFLVTHQPITKEQRWINIYKSCEYE